MPTTARRRRNDAAGLRKPQTGEVELTSALRTESSLGKTKRSSSRRISKTSRAKQYWKFLGVKPLTLQASGILIVAIFTALLWNHYESQHHNVDASVRNFLEHFCSLTYCHKGLVASRRTQQTVRVILQGQTVLQIPRQYTIFDLDALRDEWVQQELFSVEISKRHLDSAAFLAAYLARVLKQLFDQSANITMTYGDHRVTGDPILREYLSILPRSMEDFDFHPVFWSERDLEMLGLHSLAYDHVIAQRSRIRNEYDAFSSVSSKFASQISLPDYQIARVLVMTRSFGTGPLQPNEGVGYVPLEGEILSFEKDAGVDLSNGCHAMVPVLDLYDHHAKPNVAFSFDSEKRAFVVNAIAAIPSGREIFDSYGKRTDSDLFAKYGFTNGDGSEFTDASLALWHSLDPQEHNEKKFLKQMLRYLQYDDGYESCILQRGVADEEANKAWVLKGLKYEFLLLNAHDSSRWVVRMPPRDPLSVPARSSSIPIALQPPEIDMRSLQFDGRPVFSTCRLISLTHHDYNGTAVELLQKNMNNASYYLPPTRDALEFRTLMCVARMAQTALSKFGVSVHDQLDLVSLLNRNSSAFQTRNWTVAHLRLGEMQTLEALKQTAYAGLRPFQDQIDTEPVFSMRNEACPPQLLHPLLSDYMKRRDFQLQHD